MKEIVFKRGRLAAKVFRGTREAESSASGEGDSEKGGLRRTHTGREGLVGLRKKRPRGSCSI